MHPAPVYADLLAEEATTLGEPYSRHLGDGLRELRFYLGRRAEHGAADDIYDREDQ